MRIIITTKIIIPSQDGAVGSRQVFPRFLFKVK
jgi:hypothetical protein